MIHNPGTSVDASLANPGPDLTVAVEDGFAQFQSAAHQQWLSTCPYGRARRVYMVHSVPRDEVKRLVRLLRHDAAYLFVTDLREDFNCRFGTSWTDFITAMQEE